MRRLVGPRVHGNRRRLGVVPRTHYGTCQYVACAPRDMLCRLPQPSARAPVAALSAQVSMTPARVLVATLVLASMVAGTHTKSRARWPCSLQCAGRQPS